MLFTKRCSEMTSKGEHNEKKKRNRKSFRNQIETVIKWKIFLTHISKFIRRKSMCD